MEKLALEPEVALHAVDGVAGDGKLNRMEVDANLVRSAGLEPHGQKRVGGHQLDHLEVRNRIARRRRVERVPRRVGAIAADGGLDSPTPGARFAADEREVASLEATPPDEVLQTAVRLRRSRDDEKPGRIAIEAMHDSRTIALAAGDAVCEEALDERPPSHARCRMDDDAGGLVDDEQVVVLVRDRERDLIVLERRLDRVGLELDRLAAREAVALRARGAVYPDAALSEQPRGRRTGADLR